MKRLLLFSLLFLPNPIIHYTLTIIHAQETFPVNGVFDKNHNYYAFKNAKIIVDPKNTIEKGTLLIKDGIIIQAAAEVKIPQGAVVMDMNGKSIYPSLIDLNSSYGMPEVKRAAGGGRQGGPQMESGNRGAYNWNQAIKPESDAVKMFSIDSKAAEEMRKLGFGAVLTSQKDGIARGSAVLVSLAETQENGVVLKDQAAATYSFDKGSSTQDYPSSLMGAIALLRQTYLDAAWYKSDPGKKEYNISLEAFNRLQSLPQIFETGDKFSSLRADKIGDEFKVKYIIKGSGTEYQRKEEIFSTFCSYILPLNFPAPYDVEDPYDAQLVSLEDMKHWEMAPANAGIMEKKGLVFALTASDLKEKSAFWKNLRKAIEYGLSEREALNALTTIPASMMGMENKLGSLKAGMIASFIVTSGNLFDEKTSIFENWVQGVPYRLNDPNAPDLRGTYTLTTRGVINNTLKIGGEVEKLKANLEDSAKSSVSISVSAGTISLSYTLKGEAGPTRLSGTITMKDSTPRFSGRGQSTEGVWFDWSAERTAGFIRPGKKDSVKKAAPEFGEVIYPFCAYGYRTDTNKLLYRFMHRWDAILIKNTTIWTNEAEGILQNKDVLITEGKIVRIGDNLSVPKTVKAIEIDGKGKHLTAGIIDEHSHIAIAGNANEGTQASSAEVRIGDVVNPEDINIYRQLAGGVTASQLLHGSANPIGGQSALIKLRWGLAPEEMKIYRAPGFIKFALGENVKQSNWGDNNTLRFPQTRMGVEQVYYDHFTRAKEYDAKMKAWALLKPKDIEKLKLSAPRRDLELEALAEILNNKRFITCHSYVQSEVSMLMHVGDSMGFKVNTFTHILEGYKVADQMKAHGVGASTFSDWWAYKMEVKEAIPYNSALLVKMGLVTAVNSDDAEMGRRLNQEAAKAVKYGGLSEEEAWKLVTLNPAKLLHLDDRMGSVKVGKEADVVLWSDNPLSIYAKAEKTIIDGVIYYDMEADKRMRDEMQTERARLIRKMLSEKSGGTPTQKPVGKQPKVKHCMDEDDL